MGVFPADTGIVGTESGGRRAKDGKVAVGHDSFRERLCVPMARREVDKPRHLFLQGFIEAHLTGVPQEKIAALRFVVFRLRVVDRIVILKGKLHRIKERLFFFRGEGRYFSGFFKRRLCPVEFFENVRQMLLRMVKPGGLPVSADNGFTQAGESWEAFRRTPALWHSIAKRRDRLCAFLPASWLYLCCSVLFFIIERVVARLNNLCQQINRR